MKISWRAGLALTLGLSLVGLTGLELVLRATRPTAPAAAPKEVAQWDGWRGNAHRAATVDGLPYELVPNLDRTVYGWRVSTNSLGMRDDEPSQEAGVVRVACIGDSFTFGFGVDQHEVWPRLLESFLRAAAGGTGRPIDVLNYGVSGYGTRDEVRVLEARALSLEPRAVIWQYCVNDPETRARQPLSRFFAHESWWERLELVRKVRERLERRRWARAGGYLQWLHEPDGSYWRATCAGLQRARDLCAARRVPLLVVIFPICGPKPWERYPYRAQHAAVLAEAARLGLPALDLLTVFEREDPASVSLGHDDIHPNARGHDLAARAIESFLLQNAPDLGN